MKKSIVFLLVTLCMLCALLPLSASAETALARPIVSISTDAQSGYPKLTWNAVDGATEYEIYRYDVADGCYWCHASTTGTSYTDTYVAVGELHRYKVVAVNCDTNIYSAESNVVGRTCKLPRPNVSISNVISGGQPQLTWNEIDGATKYAIYRRIGSSGDYAYYAAATNTTYTDKNAVADTKYCYKVKAIHSNSAANSVESAAVGKTAKLAQPKVTISNVISSGKPQLKWNAVSGATKYAIYRRTGSNGDYAYYAAATGTTYTDKNAEVDTKYCYKVKAIHSNSAANSSQSGAVGKTCKLPQPKVTISTDSYSGVPVLSWNDVEEVLEYDIYRRVGKSGSFKYYDTVDAYETYYTDQNAQVGTLYCYKVYAVSSNQSATSAASSAVGKTCALECPDNVCIKIDNTYPRVSWDRVVGAQKYNVYRATSEFGTYKLVASTTGLTYRDTNVSRSRTYFYCVKAIHSGAAANSDYSVARGIDIQLALLSDPYDIAACAMDACYDLVKFPSTVYLEQAYYADASGANLPTVVLKCSAENELGARVLVYVLAIAMTQDDYDNGLGDGCDISYTVDDGYIVACIAYEAVSFDRTGYREISTDKVMDAYYETDYEY